LRSLRRAGGIITVSSHSRTRLLSHASRQIEVIPNGLSVARGPVRPLDQREPFLIHLGSPLPHKRSAQGVSWTLRALEDHPALGLVVTGELAAPVEASVARDSRVTRVRQALTREELWDWMSRARGLVFSSDLEGFGLPPLEALAAGMPAVWSRHSASAETMCGLPGGYGTESYDEFATALGWALRCEQAELDELSTQVRERYSWVSVGARTLAYYRRVLSGVSKLPPSATDASAEPGLP
jgi:glycosyltransferase involved in cell wall biosynthesis